MYNYNRGVLDMQCLKGTLYYINQVIHGNFLLPNTTIILNLGDVKVIDRLTFVLLECICHSVMDTYNINIGVECTITNDQLFFNTEYSPINLLNNASKFRKEFRFSLKSNYYRMVIPKEAAGTSDLSIRYSDIAGFFQNMLLPNTFSETLAETICELITNQCEHGCSSCLVDIAVCKDRLKKSEKLFDVVSVALLGFSQEQFETKLKTKIFSLKNSPDMRYNTVKEAYNYHRQFFSDKYTETDFFFSAAFQDRISSRESRIASGGTGLTKLIASLQAYSDNHNCYMLSGKRCMFFDEKYLGTDVNGWVGFNETNNFIGDIPNEKVFVASPIYMPGVAYNLNFIVK